jgi:hypothetical protein
LLMNAGGKWKSLGLSIHSRLVSPPLKPQCAKRTVAVRFGVQPDLT